MMGCCRDMVAHSPRLARRPQRIKCNPAQVTKNRIRSSQLGAGAFTVALQGLTPLFLFSAMQNRGLPPIVQKLFEADPFSSRSEKLKPRGQKCISCTNQVLNETNVLTQIIARDGMRSWLPCYWSPRSMRNVTTFFCDLV
jgi:hypothetical protein